MIIEKLRHKQEKREKFAEKLLKRREELDKGEAEAVPKNAWGRCRKKKNI